MSSQRHHQVFDAECFVYSFIYKSEIKELQRNSDPSDYTQDVSFNVLPAEMIRNLEDAYPVLTRSRMFYKFVRIIHLKLLDFFNQYDYLDIEEFVAK